MCSYLSELIRLRDSAPNKQSYEAYQHMLDEYKKSHQ